VLGQEGWTEQFMEEGKSLSNLESGFDEGVERVCDLSKPKIGGLSTNLRVNQMSKATREQTTVEPSAILGICDDFRAVGLDMFAAPPGLWWDLIGGSAGVSFIMIWTAKSDRMTKHDDENKVWVDSEWVAAWIDEEKMVEPMEAEYWPKHWQSNARASHAGRSTSRSKPERDSRALPRVIML
jgi:hypothetical protein